MKIPVNSFGLDMNALLNELNGNNIHGFYNKVIHSTNKKMSNIIGTMNQQIKEGKSNAHLRDEALKEQMNALDNANHQMWNNEMPPAVNHAFNLALNTVPRNTDYYYPNGSSGPQDPQPGDVMWQSDDWDNVGSNDFDATMYIYYKDSGWKKMNTPTQITGVNINGASIHGGMITGATFRSGSQGINGTPFWVNRDGVLYANQFESDLQHNTVGGINPYRYHGYLRYSQGFSIADGMLIMNAYAQQRQGLPIWHDNPASVGSTYLEPGYLKLRYNRDQNEQYYVRSDLRAGLLEISADSWNQDKGIKLGYWNAKNGDTPKLSFGSWIIGENGGADLDFTGPGNISTYQPIHAHGGIEADSLIVKGGFQVNNKTWADKSDINELKNRISQDEGKTDSNSDKIYDHGQILDGNDFSDPNNILNGSDNNNSHENRLNQHDNELANHQSRLDQFQNALDQTLSIKVGANGDASFSTNTSEYPIAHFVYWDDVSILGGRKLVVGGENPDSGPTMVEPNMIQTDTVYFNANGYNNPFLTADPFNGYLKYNGTDTLATTSYVREVTGRESMLSIKHDILPVSSQKALNDVLNTNIRTWIYNDDNSNHVHVGPIIDDLHSRQNEKYYTPENIIDHDPLNQNYKMINEYDSIGYLYLAIKQLAKQNSHLVQRVAKLELQK